MIGRLRSINKIGLFLSLFLPTTPALCAQVAWIPVPACGDDLTTLGDQLKIEKVPKYVLRAAAVGGSAFIPVLRTLSSPGEPNSTVPGAAQVALARLHDQQSFKELEEEINGKPGSAILAIGKLEGIRSDAAVSILMDYVIRNKQNPKRGLDHGDVVEDPMLKALAGLIGMLSAPPYSQPFTDKAHLDGWEKWWKATRLPLLTPLYEGMPDEQSRCLARLTEWGFPDAVVALYLHSGQGSVAALQTLARLGGGGPANSPFLFVSKAAQVTLAKAGDEEQFSEVVKELDDLGYEDAITKLRYIANGQAFDALLRSLNLVAFPKYRYYAEDKTLHYTGEQLQKSVMAALSEMVVNPPLPADAPANDANIKAWNSWWEANKARDVLRKVPF
jgi:hypothetical protein